MEETVSTQQNTDIKLKAAVTAEAVALEPDTKVTGEDE